MSSTTDTYPNFPTLYDFIKNLDLTSVSNIGLCQSLKDALELFDQ